jgi:hypothetical protein
MAWPRWQPLFSARQRQQMPASCTALGTGQSLKMRLRFRGLIEHVLVFRVKLQLGDTFVGRDRRVVRYVSEQVSFHELEFQEIGETRLLVTTLAAQ